jgi:hypothetical protein
VISGQQLTCTNTGGQTATGVTVRDPLPARGVFVSMSTTQGTCTRTPGRPALPKGGTVTSTVGSLGGGQSATITIVVRATKPGTLTATATVSASNVNSDMDDSATAMTTVTGT